MNLSQALFQSICRYSATRVWLILAFSILFSGCALQLISDFDQKSVDQMQNISEKVNGFYLGLSYLKQEQRTYQESAPYYLKVEEKLEALESMQRIRELNELTVKQVEIALSLWRQDRKMHKREGSLSDFIIKRRKSQYQRLFIAMIKGEDSKQKVAVQK